MKAVSQVVVSSIDELSGFRLIGIYMQRLKDLIKENRSILLAISITSATYLRFDFYAHVSEANYVKLYHARVVTSSILRTMVLHLTIANWFANF